MNKGPICAIVVMVCALQVSSYHYEEGPDSYRTADGVIHYKGSYDYRWGADRFYDDRDSYNLRQGGKLQIKESESLYERSINDLTIQPKAPFGQPIKPGSDEEYKAKQLMFIEYLNEHRRDKFSVTMDIHEIFKGRLVYKYLIVGGIRWLEDTRGNYSSCTRGSLNSFKTWFTSDRGREGAYLVDINGNAHTLAEYILQVKYGRYVKKYTVGAETRCYNNAIGGDTRCNGLLYNNESYFVAVMACSLERCISVGYLNVEQGPLPVGRVVGIVGGVVGIFLILILVVKIIRLVQKKKRLQSGFRNAEIIGNNEAGKDSKFSVLGKVQFISHIPDFLESGSPKYQHLLN